MLKILEISHNRVIMIISLSLSFEGFWFLLEDGFCFGEDFLNFFLDSEIFEFP